ncbi:hypothetical protein P280DRAFT_505120 [Massarina eburnea CBS 473.64]|uniref:Uncharacterized protein n=1 Tax=Massarina eburnea CBS 473.64 TaxID=1395130 RepID=A0A6A6SC53_9PLEO|nr:hypothetical protein P280DRAFT_505120 [Massarina eburnea CBS 473.64]
MPTSNKNIFTLLPRSPQDSSTDSTCSSTPPTVAITQARVEDPEPGPQPWGHYRRVSRAAPVEFGDELRHARSQPPESVPPPIGDGGDTPRPRPAAVSAITKINMGQRQQRHKSADHGYGPPKQQHIAVQRNAPSHYPFVNSSGAPAWYRPYNPYVYTTVAPPPIAFTPAVALSQQVTQAATGAPPAALTRQPRKTATAPTEPELVPSVKTTHAFNINEGFKELKVMMGPFILLHSKLVSVSAYKPGVDFLDRIFAPGTEIAEDRDPIMPGAIIYSKTYIVSEKDYDIYHDLLKMFPIVEAYKEMLSVDRQEFDQVQAIEGSDRGAIAAFVGNGATLEEMLGELVASNGLGVRHDLKKPDPFKETVNQWGSK